MYPVFRFTKEMLAARRLEPLSPLGTHVSHHICWPWDIDLWMELNNGRTLTFYDLGRIPLAVRVGLARILSEKKLGMVIAGASVRYRRRIRVFERVEMRSRAVCWDDRFLYVEQAMFKAGGECANHALLRCAVTGPSGIVPPGEAAPSFGPSPDMPEWVRAWSEADATRPWPPMQESLA
ncbi:Thioesterase-like superfamily protein [Poseidonocella pacifica]|uniref:Thioesterase-like superfamily protein n=1 Tax=Poseidonocella pacifica TaxID=871651 RepID=A0A1I0XAX9_9RHOB|nr:acyl-CoA thioesterase [Poseidonocella pacifica]SFA98239.1 Thioesterase-like superfamily protein [Poseidonocella pacifica]